MTDAKKLIVIGGGPAGMMAAGTAASRGLEVILVEKNKKVGKKLFITGKGRCNITNSIDVEGLIRNVPVNGNFLYSAFYTFTNDDVINFFENLGVKVKEERGGRIFPQSDQAADVVNALERYMAGNNVKILHGTVAKILTANQKVTGVRLKDGRTLSCESVVIATGGKSYPGTGATGDGYTFARQLGHTVTSLNPSLVPLEVQEEWVKALQGLSLKNIAITVLNDKDKKIYTDFGEMLFTHFGVSGPVILSASSHMRDMKKQSYRVIVDLKPALSEEQLDKRIQRDFEKYARKHYINALDDLLPKKLVPVIAELSQIPKDKPVHQITKQERKTVVVLMKNLLLHIRRFRPLAEAIITSGGVHTDEINPGTMESKIINGLFFAGEVIDVDAYTGGFNLQIAFSTGYIAGYHV